MELITDNILAAFISGTSTLQEEKLVMNELVENEEFSDLLNVIDEVNSMDCINELRNEFNEISDDYTFSDYNINVK